MADSNILSDFGIKILEQEIDDVIFQTNSYFMKKAITGRTSRRNRMAFSGVSSGR